MSSRAKLAIGVTMTLALAFGYFHSAWPEAPVSFKRLHIFLLNLVSGGSLILYHTEGKGIFTTRVRIYFTLALLYALSAAARWYVPALILSLPLFFLVESVRIGRFSFLCLDLFRTDVPVHLKFNQASLLCLSLAIAIASLVIINNEYLHWVEYEKLTLDVFFLGYSFPISLITMSVMFSFMTEREGWVVTLLKELSFWSVNLGVIIFFVFIILEMFISEITVASTLFLTVWVIFFLFLATAPRVQQKTFLVSGMVFLLFTAVTGILYILRYFSPPLEPYTQHLLLLHAMVSLYGWNLSGLFIIIRWSDFPIQLSSALAVGLHWSIVLVLAPLGTYLLPVSGVALVTYVGLLIIVFVGRSNHRGWSG